MDRSLEPSLRGLIPSHNGDLPQELVQLTRSLYSQSRTKVLKQDEEVARTYVCAHIACQRLKQRLNLPQIVPRPPCGPRVYKKLFEFFDTTLAARIAEPGTPSRSKRNVNPSSPLQRTPSKSTPKAATPLKRAISRRQEPIEDDVPEWTMQAIRQLCRSFDTPDAAPHVYAGVTSVVKLLEADAVAGVKTTPAQSRTRAVASVPQPVRGTSKGPVRFPAMLIATFLCVKTRMLSEPLTTEKFARDKARAIQILSRAGHAGIREAAQEISSEITKYAKETPRWQEMDWFANIPEGYTQGNGGEDHDSDLLADQEQERDQSLRKKARHDQQQTIAHPGESDSLQTGLGTMMQDRIDWNSEERRLDFIDWKSRIMKRIEEIEQNHNVGESMDTGP